MRGGCAQQQITELGGDQQEGPLPVTGAAKALLLSNSTGNRCANAERGGGSTATTARESSMENGSRSTLPIRTVGRRHDDGRFVSLEEALANPDICSIERYPALGRLPDVS